MSKIIFLDFHGPLTNNRIWVLTGNQEDFDPGFLKFLNIACEKSDTKIVSISDYGGIHHPHQKKNAFLLFERAGFNTDHIHQDWSAFGLAEEYGGKSLHIRKWLENHPEIRGEDCLVIRDGPDRKSPGPWSEIWVDTHDGIPYQRYSKIAGFLGVDDIEIERLNTQNHEMQNRVLYQQLEP